MQIKLPAAALCVALFASNLTGEEKIEITKMREELVEIKTLVDGSKCKDALPRLRKLLLLKPDDEATNFYLGMCAREEKSYDESLAAFERMTIINPDNKRVRLEIARLYFEEGSFKQAEDEFNAILADKDIPEAVKNNVRQLLEAIKQTQKKYTINGAVIAGVKFDGNTNQGYTGIVDGAANRRESDFSHSEILALFHSYDIGDKGGLLWKNEGILYNQLMRKQTDKNLLFSSIASGMEYNFGNHAIYFPLTYEHIKYGSDDLMQSIGISAKLDNKLSDMLKLHTEYGVKRQFYFEKYDFNGNTEAGTKEWLQNSIKQSYQNKLDIHFEKPMLDIALTLALEKTQEIPNNQSTDKTINRHDVSSSSKEYKIEISKEILKDYTPSLGYAYKQTGYTDNEPATSFSTFADRRKDNTVKYKFSNRYKFSDTILGTLEYEHTKNTSNWSIKAYEQDTYSATIMKLF